MKEWDYTKSVELIMLRYRGTGIPKKRNRQAHTILAYSMNIAYFVPFL